MKNILTFLVIVFILAAPMAVLANEGPMKLAAGASDEAKGHNQEGIDHWNKGHFDVALKHFQAASKIDKSQGAAHFNEAICLDKLGKHGDATMHFKAAKKNAGGDKMILESAILNAHIGH